MIRFIALSICCILVCIAGMGVATNTDPFVIETGWLRAVVSIFAWGIASCIGFFALTGK